MILERSLQDADSVLFYRGKIRFMQQIPIKQNENRPPLDLSTLIPLGVGAVSLFGICLLLVASRLATPRSTVQAPDTATPFQYLFIGTEPGILSAIPDENGTPGENLNLDPFGETPGNSANSTPGSGFAITAQSGISTSNPSSNPSSATQKVPTSLSSEEPILIFPGNRTPTLTVGAPLPTRTYTLTFAPSSTPTNRNVSKTPANYWTSLPGATNPNATPTRTATATRTFTPTTVSTAPLNPGTYDDTDSHLIYSGTWQTNASGLYMGTLHVSTTTGNSVSFQFIGNQIRIFYQSGTGLGKMLAEIDEQQFELDQSIRDRSEWVIDVLEEGTHSVTIRHIPGGSGGAINLDKIIVPDVAATPTFTATATSTP
jgi:hypothetical protein